MWTHSLFDDGGNNQRHKRCYCCRYNCCYDDVPSFSWFFRLLRYHFFDTIKRGHNPCQFFVCPCRYSIQKPQSIVQFWGALYPYISDTAKTLASISMRLPSFTGADSIIPDAIDWSIASLLSPVTGMDSRQ